MKFIPAMLLSCVFISSLTLITPAMAQRGGPGMGGGGMGGGGMGGRMGPAMGGPSMGGRIDVLTPAQDMYLNSWEHGS